MPVQGEKLILGLSALLQLGKRAFAAENELAFAFLVVNETHLMTPYRQAVLWRHGIKGSGAVVAVSGSPEPNTRAPFIAWLGRILNTETMRQHTSPLTFTAADLPAEEGSAWEQWFPTHAVWVPLITGLGERKGGMLLVKSVPWTEPEIKLLTKLSDSYAHAWELVHKRTQCGGLAWYKIFTTRRSWVRFVLIGLVVLLFWLPLHQSTLAPATVVALDPMPVRSPMEGVVDQIHVTPNQPVNKGDLLITLDDALLKSRMEVEQRTLTMLEEEYRQILKMAVTDAESRTRKGILEKGLEKQQAEMHGVRIQLERMRIFAPRDGIALFNEVHSWLGKPVQIGERVMEIADPHAAELEIRLPVGDAMAMEPGAMVTLYPNQDPLSTWSAKVTRIAYGATEMEGVLAYGIKAQFSSERLPPGIGLRGTAKIQGQETTLFYFLFRHPLALLRQRLGL
ncbi:MAG: HlyD family efflux transporter periplasmic adaptor subunit [Magnetococcales bacterium]|nr:HlyD family efflux transporter periplasmic adaptor subunit [Magnetococcales bacterium]